MSFTASLGTFAGDFTQHSLVFLHFVALMSPLRHHPLILLPHQSALVFLFRDSTWWKPVRYSFCVHLVSFVLHSSPLEAEGKKAGATTAGRPCTLSTCHSRLMSRRRCLVGEKTFASSRLSWVLYEAWIFASVSGEGPQTFRRWFHVPLMIVHPVLDDCVMVVRPSCVNTNDPSIFSCHRNDFCCSWTHPKSFSPFGQVWLRNPSRSGGIFVSVCVPIRILPVRLLGVPFAFQFQSPIFCHWGLV
jgi:hypothetical protein